MRYKKIILFFCIALPVCIVMRLLQLIYTIDNVTGFFKQEYKNVGYYLLVIIVAFSVVTAILSFTAHRRPDNPPKINIFIALSSFAMAAAIAYELSAESFSTIVRPWQTSLLTLTGIGTIIYFVLFGLNFFVDIKLPTLCAVIPALYYILRIICTFTSISSLALITDNILLIASYCIILLFMMSFAKLYNKIDTETNFRKLLATGLTSVILCFTQSVPNFIVNIITNNGYLHTASVTNISILFTGIFIGVFTFSHFSLDNVAKKRKRRVRDLTGQQLYM